MFDPIEWGRVNRGRVWHIMATADRGDVSGDELLCGEVEYVKEVTQGLPPMGGTPCARCLRKVDELTSAARCALDNAVRDTLARGVEPADHVGDQGGSEDEPDPEPAREVEVVDLVGALRRSVDAATERRRIAAASHPAEPGPVSPAGSCHCQVCERLVVLAGESGTVWLHA